MSPGAFERYPQSFNKNTQYLIGKKMSLGAPEIYPQSLNKKLNNKSVRICLWELQGDLFDF